MADGKKKYAYEKLMADEKVEYKDLPKDAKYGIDAIKRIEKGIFLLESKGKGQKVSPETYEKIEANDRWVVSLIVDMLDEENKDRGDIPNLPEEVIQDAKDEAKKEEQKKDEGNKPDSKDEPIDKEGGLKIDAELTELSKREKKSFTLDEIKKEAPVTYSVLFDAYTEGQENGIITSKFELIETEKQIFNLK